MTVVTEIQRWSLHSSFSILCGYFSKQNEIEMVKVQLLYKPGYVMLCVGNLMEEKSSVRMFEIPAGI
jgi:hypothetical protein